ncbi:MAG: SDR family oxidoreductase [Gammaproteobacteria bacterium]|nr:SDR family oxidoreductase [Gammaproteobacteria bacterium]
MNLGLHGLRALVTGGSRGIGRAVVQVLAEENCQVAFCARTPRAVAAAESDLRQQGLAVSGAVVDITDDPAVEAWTKTCADCMGGIDILVANAGAVANKPELSAWQAGFETDVMGTVRTVEQAIPFLRESNAASVVVMSSVAALEIYAGERPYNAIQATLTAYAGGLAQRLAPDGIRANTVSPGAIIFPGSVWERAQVDQPGIYNEILSRTALNRLGTAHEVATAVAFLSSPAAAYVTGSNFVIDGGLTKRVHY